MREEFLSLSIMDGEWGDGPYSDTLDEILDELIDEGLVIESVSVVKESEIALDSV